MGVSLLFYSFRRNPCRRVGREANCAEHRGWWGTGRARSTDPSGVWAKGRWLRTVRMQRTGFPCCANSTRQRPQSLEWACNSWKYKTKKIWWEIAKKQGLWNNLYLKEWFYRTKNHGEKKGSRIPQKIDSRVQQKHLQFNPYFLVPRLRNERKKKKSHWNNLEQQAKKHLLKTS